MNQRIALKIGKKNYEQVCSYNHVSEIYEIFEQKFIKVKFNKIEEERYADTYTKEMELNMLETIILRKLKNKNKIIDFNRCILKIILNTRNEENFINFICDKINEFKPILKQQNYVQTI